MRAAAPLLLAAAAASSTTSECGPKPHEVGLAVLAVTPVVFVVVWAASAILMRLWRRFRPEVWPSSWRAPALCLAGLCLPALLALLDGRGNTLLLAALVLYGTSYAAVALVALRLFVWVVPARAAWLCQLPSVVLYVPPAVLLALEVVREPSFLQPADYFALAGMAGWVPGGILAALLVEIGVRSWRLRRAAPPPAP